MYVISYITTTRRVVFFFFFLPNLHDLFNSFNSILPTYKEALPRCNTRVGLLRRDPISHLYPLSGDIGFSNINDIAKFFIVIVCLHDTNSAHSFESVLFFFLEIFYETL